MTVQGHGWDDNVGYPAFRNLFYNGNMQVTQRGTSTASITATGYYTADRWSTVLSTMGTWTQSVEADAPTGTGLRNSLKMLCTTADAAPAASDVVVVRQSFEGYDCQRLAKGTPSAKEMTLTFWVKSNVTGTYTIQFFDVDNVRSVSVLYTIVSSGTWEKKTLSVPADTTGVLDNNSDASLRVRWNLGLGSDFTSSPVQTVWGPQVNATMGQGQVNVAAAINNYWQITGVQLEAGSIATPFEFTPYGTELNRCQRYYETGRADLTFQNCDTLRQSNHWFPLRVTKRAGSPTTSLTQLAGTNVGYIAFFATDTGAYLRWNSTSVTDFGGAWTWTVASEL